MESLRVYPKLSNPRYHSLDLWRGIACLCVVILHAPFSAEIPTALRLSQPLASRLLDSFWRMEFGVPMFFVISGYCIAATCDSSRRKSNGVTLDYFKRRLRRIFPPFWAVIALTAALAFVLARIGYSEFLAIPREGVSFPLALSASQLFGNLTLTETWRSHLFGNAKMLWISPLWTLCYEEQFYVVCGLLLLAPRRFFSGVVAVSAMTVLTLTASIFIPRFRIDGFFFDGFWLAFAAGVLVYFQINYRAAGRNRSTLLILGIAMALIAFARYGLLRHSDNARLQFELYNLLQAGVFAGAIVLLHPFDARLSTARIMQPFMYCGKMCYSLYLIHWPVMLLLGHALHLIGVRGPIAVLTIVTPAITIASVGAGSVFHHLVERHFLNAPSRAEKSDSAPDAAASIVLAKAA